MSRVTIFSRLLEVTVDEDCDEESLADLVDGLSLDIANQVKHNIQETASKYGGLSLPGLMVSLSDPPSGPTHQPFLPSLSPATGFGSEPWLRSELDRSEPGEMEEGGPTGRRLEL